MTTMKPYTKPEPKHVPTVFQMPESVGWYYAADDTEGPWYGPYASPDEAREAARDDDEDPALVSVAYMKRAPVSCALFNGEAVLDNLIDYNEESVWWEHEPETPSREALRELEDMLAQALYVWMRKHEYWREFRGLVEVRHAV